MGQTKQTDIRKKAVIAALSLAQSYGWQHVRLNDIAEEAELSLAELHDHFADKFDILAALGRMIDQRVLENIPQPAADTPARDRLFDVLMERFDALNDHRDGIIAILNSFRGDPKDALCSLPHLGRSMVWMLEAAGIEATGWKGALKVAGLSALYLKILKTWKEDDSPDMSRTMAALDKALNRAEQMANTLGF